MNLDIVAAPETAPQIPNVPHRSRMPVLDTQDSEVLDIISQHNALPITSLLNFLTSEQAPKDRSEERKLWLGTWHRLRRLLRLGLVFRAGRTNVSLLKHVSEVRRRPVKRRQLKPTVPPNAIEPRASTQTHRSDAPSSSPLEEPQNQLPTAQPRTQSTSQPTAETKCASPEQTASAAHSLAKLPRRRRRMWTGWIGQTHAYRNMRIVLPSGEVAFVAGVLRGRCVFTFNVSELIGGFDGEPFQWGVVPAREVQVVKNVAAQRLAAQKRGVKERPSEKKKAACRLNALVPPRPGSRPRGRPSKTAVSAGAVQQSEQTVMEPSLCSAFSTGPSSL